ncbi:uncharacterized protein Dvar_46950 [Desulfosarcina variabilis str. Montpellier]|jgi:hypothetical protein|uniref:HNH endonuclease n=1 Tax=Desulfosarcina variabilis TaxID=2300 RepID=UPI003AFA928D
MALSKLELQQMLREMNVKFSADETYEELKHRLQQKNHSLWLKSVSGSQTAKGGKTRVVVRKRKETRPPADENGAPATEQRVTKPRYPERLGDGDRKQKFANRPRPVDKPAPGQHWKSAADGTEPFNRTKNVFNSVLRRAKHCCERCGQKSASGSQAFELQPYHIQPLSEGGEHSIKNVVALCPSCLEAMDQDPSAKELKELKRKTRSRLYDSLQVVRKKKNTRRRRPASD